MKCGPKDIVVGQIFDDAIIDFFIRGFRFKCAEHLVPRDEYASIVAVDIAGIGRMMHAVMRWRVHHRLKPAWHPVNRFGMDPILVDEIESGEKEYQCGRKAQKE